MDAEAQRGLAGALLLAVAILTAITLFFPGGDLGSLWAGWITRTFGWGSLLVAVMVGVTGATLLRARAGSGFALSPVQTAGIVLLLVVLLSFLHLMAGLPPSLQLAASGEGGGQVGYLVSHGLVGALGPAGAAIVLLGLGVLGTATGLNFGFRDLVRVMVTAYARSREYYDLHWRPVPGPSQGQASQGSDPAVESAVAEPAAMPKADAQPAGTSPPATAQQMPLPRPVASRSWQLPTLDLLEATVEQEIGQVDIRRRVKVIEDTLQSFNITARVVEVNQGPTVTQFGLQPAPGVTVNRIVARANDLALALAAAPIRIEAPVPGKAVVGIEVPNAVSSLVGLRSVIETAGFQKLRARSKLAIALGQDVSGASVCADLGKMPHLLIAGATGSGKTVCLNSIIAAFLFGATPEEVKLLMVDPKMVELVGFNGIPHLIAPVVTDASKVANVLKWSTREMERRYKLFSASGARNIDGYNRLGPSKRGTDPLPYIVVVIDELADVMMMAPEETERLICRLAQMARATGIHLLVATQRPSVDVITGLIKANFPARISFAVSSQIDSRVVLDMAGAEKLLGRGDMLYMASDSAKTVRLQGAWVSDQELEQLVAFWKDQSVGSAPALAEIDATTDATALGRPADAFGTSSLAPWSDDEEPDEDELLSQAIDTVRQAGRASASLLQRKLRIGYARAGRLIDLMEEQGVIGGPAEGGRAREVLDTVVPSEEAVS